MKELFWRKVSFFHPISYLPKCFNKAKPGRVVRSGFYVFLVRGSFRNIMDACLRGLKRLAVFLARTGSDDATVDEAVQIPVPVADQHRQMSRQA